MIFLIQYDREAGRLLSIRDFQTSQRAAAEDSRMEMEFDLARRGLDHEVVLLEALDREALHQTHRRYFADLRELLESATKPPKNGGASKD